MGLSKEAEPDDLKNLLIEKGLAIVNVECLTRPELIKDNLVRSKTMKVTIKPSDYEKALVPEVWPARVSVRHFRAPPRKRPGREGGQLENRLSDRNNQRRPVHANDDQSQSHRSNHHRRGSVIIPTENRFSIFEDDDDSFSTPRP